MAVYYLEASALMKLYKSEAGSDIVTELVRNKATDETFVTSHLTIFEISSSSARLLKNGEITRARYSMIVGTLAEDLNRYAIIVLPLQSALVTEALALLPDYPLRAGDALHVATARRLQEALDDEAMYVVVADKRISETCAAIDLSQLNPETPGASKLLSRIRGE